SRPEPDVHRRRVLGLQRAHPLEHLRDRRPHPLEQDLASQERAIELLLCQYPASRHFGRAVSFSGGLFAAGLWQNETAFDPQRSDELPPMVLGTSMRMQPAPRGVPVVPFPLVAIATTTVATAAVANRAQNTRTSTLSRVVVCLSGVLTRSQCPCSGTGSVYGRI